MKLLAAIALPLLCSAKVESEQCCLGAQNSAETSHGGQYVVEATSLTGTGHPNHGPYRFRFRTLRVGSDGTREQIGVFERAWDTREHFGMTIAVSPSGNGFAMSSSLEEPVLFFTPDGQIVATISGHESQTMSWSRAGLPPLEYTLYGDTGKGSRESRLWLPLLHVVGPETKWVSSEEPSVLVEGDDVGYATVPAEELRWLTEMLAWRPQRGERDAERVATLIAKPDVEALVDLGLSALPSIERTLDSPRKDADLELARREILRRLCGHRAPWRNLDLLAALLDHPSKELSACAAAQLELVAPGLEITAPWLAKHRGTLRWDEKAAVYRRR